MRWRPEWLMVLCACLHATASGATLFVDSFDLNTSANYTVRTSSADTRVTFAYDYSADGIPPPPFTGVTTTRGLKLEVNMATPAATEGVTLTPTALTVTGDYTIDFDLWLNINGPFPANGTGSTQFITAGIGYDGTTVNRIVTDGTPSANTGSGAWFAVDGDGDITRDFRAFKNAVEVLASASAPDNNVFAAGTSSSSSHNSSTSYYTTRFPYGTAAPVTQQRATQQQTGTLSAGAIGLKWRKMEIRKIGSSVTWRLDGYPIATLVSTGEVPFR